MDKITGRSDDMLIIRGVNVFPTQIEELVLKCPELAPHYLIEVSRQGNLDQMTVTVELNEQFSRQLGAELRTDVASRLQHDVKNNVGITVKVLLVDPTALERSAGKACRVIDRRPKAPVEQQRELSGRTQ
jgi:phenylacetate-CoA ligase